jgi:hypothetical protein
MRLIYNSDAQRLQKNFDDKTPVTVSELFRSERTASVPIELFLVDNDGGYATPGSSDYEVLIGRQAQAVTTGKLTLTFTGTTEEIDLSKPKLATRIEAALNAVSEVNAAGGVDVVELKNGRAFQITFRSVGSRAAITAGVKDSMQPASVLISEVTAGTGSTREVQLLTLEEASLAEVSTSGWSANSNPALTITTLVEGTANTREVVQLSVSNDPAPGSFFVVSNSEPISTEATAAQVKTILNSALSNDIGSVKKTGERIWQITYKTNGDKTALSAGTHNLVKRPSVNATLSLNTTALAYAANSDGSDLSVGFTLKKSNEVLLSENVDLAEPFAEVIGSSAMLNNDSLGALFTIAGDDVNKGTAISLSGGLTYSSDTLAAPFLPLAGGTMTGNILLGNDVKVRFGSEPNLEIYSTGSASYIKDIGTGSLYLSGGGSVYIESPAGETMAKFQGNGSVDLYYDNSKKFETTSLGATISGKLIVNGDLDVSGTTTTFNSTVVTVDDPVFTVGGDTAPVASDNKDRGIEFRYFRSGESAKVGFFGYDNSENAFTILTDATNNSEVFSGTLADLNCGLITVKHGTPVLKLNDTSSGAITTFTLDGTSTTINNQGTGGNLIFSTQGTEAGRFDSSGRLGISTDNPSHKLNISVSDSDDGIVLQKAGSSNDLFKFSMDGTNDRAELFQYSQGNVIFAVRPSNFGYINTGQNFGIGTTSPSTILEVSGSGAGAAGLDLSQGESSSISNRLFFTNATATEGIALYNLSGTLIFSTGAQPANTSGDARMYLNSTGLGIGGTPSELLDVHGAESKIKLTSTSHSRDTIFQQGGGHFHIKTSHANGVAINNGSSSAGQLGIYNSSTESIRLAANGDSYFNGGNVGIGGTPNEKFSIINTGGICGMNLKSASDNLCFIDFGDSDDGNIGGINYNNSNDTLNLRAGNANRLTVNSSGNVAIGQTSAYTPTGSGVTRLTATHSADSNTNLVVSNQTNGTAAMARLVLATYGHDYIIGAQSLAGGSALTFNKGATERMRIDASGNVGIGCSPSANVDIYNGSGWAELHLDGSSGGELKLQKAGTTHLDLYASDSGSTGSVIKAQSNLQLSSNNSTDANRSIYLNSSGNVGIATTTPSANADLTLGNGELCMAETTTPTADANFGKIYCKSDNKLYFQDGAGTEHEIAFV